MHPARTNIANFTKNVFYQQTIKRNAVQSTTTTFERKESIQIVKLQHTAYMYNK